MELFREYAEFGNETKIFNFRSGMATYGNIIKDGIFRSLGWNGAGYDVRDGEMVSENGVYDIEEQSGFIVELNGQTLISNWEYLSTVRIEGEKSLIVRIELKHKIVPALVTVVTEYCGSGAISRWLEITNNSDAPMTLGRLAPFAGILETTKNWRKQISGDDEYKTSPYRLGYFESFQHMHEGQFKWHELHTDCYSFGGRYTRQRQRHPFFALENKAKGTTFVGQIAWSGGYKFSFDFNANPSDGNLALVCDIDGTKPLRVIAPNEKITTPEVIISMVNGDLDDAINNMHSHIRKCVMKMPHGEGCYTETAGGGKVGDAKAAAKKAKEQGFDIFYIDAGWYFPEGEYCLAWTGTWEPDPVRFPNGMRELTDYCHEIGIKLGLWMEPERVGSLCPIADKDIDKYLIQRNGKNNGGHPTSDKGGLYDLSREDVLDYIEKQICGMIEKTGLDMFRLDFNLDYIAPWCFNMRDGYTEGADYRYCENFYAMFDRIRNKYPSVIFENCASGGGRTDLGCVKYFDHTWVTDNPIAPRCFAITNGMTMCLPPEIVDRLVTTMDAPTMGNLTFDLYQLMFVRPTSHFPRETPENPIAMKKFNEFMELYNSFARPMLKECKIYHHTPSFNDFEPKGVGILEEVADDSSRAMLGVFALSDVGCEEKTVKFKGINASYKYRVKALESGEAFEISGYELKYKGLTVALHGSLTAELFLAERI